MAEFNGDLNSSGYVGGVNWTGVNRFMTATADAPEDQGSYLGEADKFNDLSQQKRKYLIPLINI